ncbi:MAG: succinylglutamate desuccinylase/aspartoacylase family protein [Candidatus Gracilibacteria bacterium]|nr:succinylglutamate desuccinylase/aspartoacylase family protein [Candidatus Gracilibacteria bacterium]
MNLLNSTYNGIQGVHLLDSGKAGPTVGISACTHGGEHAGLRVINHLVDDFGIAQKLVCGKIFLILTNIQAYELSLQTSHPADARFVDENLNRCCTEENLLTGTSYEANRARELEPILANLEYHLDIHSTYSKSQAVGIITEKGKERMGAVMNVDVVFENLTQVQIGRPFIDITERHGGVGIGLEAGWEEDEAGFRIGVENSLRLLSDLKLLEDSSVDSNQYPIKENKKIFVYGSVVPKGKNFQPARNFNHGNIVQKNEVIGQDDVGTHVASEDSIIIMPSVPEKLRIILEKGQIEEFCFLGRIS